ncbi:MAG: energy-coupling factor transporter transmembrane protein EcfT [Campylobacteraceae bacterium]|jgi:cobalt/nickel transport system permease protein|nr:energy-coupling factor transporter transmembrane protein EcfT [Campylobacteraceae bacterium]
MKQISPLSALLATLFYSFAVALQGHIYILMFLPPLFLACVDFKALRYVLKKLLFLNIFIIIIVISLLIERDFHNALLIFIRSNLILTTALLLFHKRDEFDIALSLRQLHLPHKLTSIVFFTARGIFLIKREFGLFKKALYIRGFKPKTDLLSYKIMAGFVGILIIKAYERAKFLQKSMILRGFKGEVYTLRAHQAFGFYDTLLCLTILISPLLRWGVIV